MPRSIRTLLVPLAAFGLATTACGGGDDDASAGDSEITGDVTVFAAASLTESFTEIGDAFGAEHPDAVTFNFASSSDLVAQILEGAPADVFASADQNNMAKLTDASGASGEPLVFATNSLQIAVEPGNPLDITGVADLQNPDLVIVTCDPDVPIGRYSQEVFANAGVSVTPDSYEEDVKAVLNKVVLGEADAGVVYTTDVSAAGDAVTGVEIPADVTVAPEYPISVTAAAPNPAGAAAFVEFFRSDAGQAILQRLGFSAP